MSKTCIACPELQHVAQARYCWHCAAALHAPNQTTRRRNAPVSNSGWRVKEFTLPSVQEVADGTIGRTLLWLQYMEWLCQQYKNLAKAQTAQFRALWTAAQAAFSQLPIDLPTSHTPVPGVGSQTARMLRTVAGCLLQGLIQQHSSGQALYKTLRRAVDAYGMSLLRMQRWKDKLADARVTTNVPQAPPPKPGTMARWSGSRRNLDTTDDSSSTSSSDTMDLQVVHRCFVESVYSGVVGAADMARGWLEGAHRVGSDTISNALCLQSTLKHMQEVCLPPREKMYLQSPTPSAPLDVVKPRTVNVPFQKPVKPKNDAAMLRKPIERKAAHTPQTHKITLSSVSTSVAQPSVSLVETRKICPVKVVSADKMLSSIYQTFYGASQQELRIDKSIMFPEYYQGQTILLPREDKETYIAPPVCCGLFVSELTDGADTFSYNALTSHSSAHTQKSVRTNQSSSAARAAGGNTESFISGGWFLPFATPWLPSAYFNTYVAALKAPSTTNHSSVATNSAGVRTRARKRSAFSRLKSIFKKKKKKKASQRVPDRMLQHNRKETKGDRSGRSGNSEIGDADELVRAILQYKVHKHPLPHFALRISPAGRNASDSVQTSSDVYGHTGNAHSTTVARMSGLRVCLQSESSWLTECAEGIWFSTPSGQNSATHQPSRSDVHVRKRGSLHPVYEPECNDQGNVPHCESPGVHEVTFSQLSQRACLVMWQWYVASALLRRCVTRDDEKSPQRTESQYVQSQDSSQPPSQRQYAATPGRLRRVRKVRRLPGLPGAEPDGPDDGTRTSDRGGSMQKDSVSTLPLFALSSRLRSASLQRTPGNTLLPSIELITESTESCDQVTSTSLGKCCCWRSDVVNELNQSHSAWAGEMASASASAPFGSWVWFRQACKSLCGVSHALCSACRSQLIGASQLCSQVLNVPSFQRVNASTQWAVQLVMAWMCQSPLSLVISSLSPQGSAVAMLCLLQSCVYACSHTPTPKPPQCQRLTNRINDCIHILALWHASSDSRNVESDSDTDDTDDSCKDSDPQESKHFQDSDHERARSQSGTLHIDTYGHSYRYGAGDVSSVPVHSLTADDADDITVLLVNDLIALWSLSHSRYNVGEFSTSGVSVQGRMVSVCKHRTLSASSLSCVIHRSVEPMQCVCGVVHKLNAPHQAAMGGDTVWISVPIRRRSERDVLRLTVMVNFSASESSVRARSGGGANDGCDVSDGGASLSRAVMMGRRPVTHLSLSHHYPAHFRVNCIFSVLAQCAARYQNSAHSSGNCTDAFARIQHFLHMCCVYPQHSEEVEIFSPRHMGAGYRWLSDKHTPVSGSTAPMDPSRGDETRCSDAKSWNVLPDMPSGSGMMVAPVLLSLAVCRYSFANAISSAIQALSRAQEFRISHDFQKYGSRATGGLVRASSLPGGLMGVFFGATAANNDENFLHWISGLHSLRNVMSDGGVCGCVCFGTTCFHRRLTRTACDRWFFTLCTEVLADSHHSARDSLKHYVSGLKVTSAPRSLAQTAVELRLLSAELLSMLVARLSSTDRQSAFVRFLCYVGGTCDGIARHSLHTLVPVLVSMLVQHSVVQRISPALHSAFAVKHACVSLCWAVHVFQTARYLHLLCTQAARVLSPSPGTSTVANTSTKTKSNSNTTTSRASARAGSQHNYNCVRADGKVISAETSGDSDNAMFSINNSLRGNDRHLDKEAFLLLLARCGAYNGDIWTTVWRVCYAEEAKKDSFATTTARHSRDGSVRSLAENAVVTRIYQWNQRVNGQLCAMLRKLMAGWLRKIHNHTVGALSFAATSDQRDPETTLGSIVDASEQQFSVSIPRSLSFFLSSAGDSSQSGPPVLRVNGNESPIQTANSTSNAPHTTTPRHTASIPEELIRPLICVFLSGAAAVGHVFSNSVVSVIRKLPLIAEALSTTTSATTSSGAKLPSASSSSSRDSGRNSFRNPLRRRMNWTDRKTSVSRRVDRVWQLWNKYDGVCYGQGRPRHCQPHTDSIGDVVMCDTARIAALRHTRSVCQVLIATDVLSQCTTNRAVLRHVLPPMCVSVLQRARQWSAAVRVCSSDRKRVLLWAFCNHVLPVSEFYARVLRNFTLSQHTAIDQWVQRSVSLDGFRTGTSDVARGYQSKSSAEYKSAGSGSGMGRDVSAPQHGLPSIPQVEAPRTTTAPFSASLVDLSSIVFCQLELYFEVIGEVWVHLRGLVSKHRALNSNDGCRWWWSDQASYETLLRDLMSGSVDKLCSCGGFCVVAGVSLSACIRQCIYHMFEFVRYVNLSVTAYVSCVVAGVEWNPGVTQYSSIFTPRPGLTSKQLVAAMRRWRSQGLLTSVHVNSLLSVMQLAAYRMQHRRSVSHSSSLGDHDSLVGALSHHGSFQLTTQATKGMCFVGMQGATSEWPRVPLSNSVQTDGQDSKSQQIDVFLPVTALALKCAREVRLSGHTALRRCARSLCVRLSNLWTLANKLDQHSRRYRSQFNKLMGTVGLQSLFTCPESKSGEDATNSHTDDLSSAQPDAECWLDVDNRSMLLWLARAIGLYETECPPCGRAPVVPSKYLGHSSPTPFDMSKDPIHHNIAHLRTTLASFVVRVLWFECGVLRHLYQHAGPGRAEGASESGRRRVGSVATHTHNAHRSANGMLTLRAVVVDMVMDDSMSLLFTWLPQDAFPSVVQEVFSELCAAWVLRVRRITSGGAGPPLNVLLSDLDHISAVFGQEMDPDSVTRVVTPVKQTVCAMFS